MKVLKFFAPYCGQCKVVEREFQLHPLVVPLENIDATQDTKAVNKYNVKHLPTIILVDDDEIIETWRGIIKSEVINEKIKELGSNSNTGNSLE